MQKWEGLVRDSRRWMAAKSLRKKIRPRLCLLCLVYGGCCVEILQKWLNLTKKTPPKHNQSSYVYWRYSGFLESIFQDAFGIRVRWFASSVSKSPICIVISKGKYETPDKLGTGSVLLLKSILIFKRRKSIYHYFHRSECLCYLRKSASLWGSMQIFLWISVLST